MNAMLRGSNSRLKDLEGALAAELAEQVGAGDGPGEPVHDRVVDGQRRAGDDGEGQAVGEAGGDRPGPAGPGDAYPRGGHSRAQVGHGHAGQSDPGRLQQPTGHLLGMIVAHGALLVEVAAAAELAPELFGGEPDRQRPVASVVGEDHEHMADFHPPVWCASGPGVGVRDADSGHGDPPGEDGDEVGAVRGDVLAQPAAGLVQAGLGGAGSGGDLAGGLVGVVEQGDGVALSGGQAGDRAAQRVGAVHVLSRRQAVGGGRVQVLGPLPEQGERRAAPLGAADVGHDAGQPGGEPAGVAQPVQRDERLQERVLHGIVGVVWLPRGRYRAV
jgi:hypothetical protein